MAFVATAAAYGFKYDDDTKLAAVRGLKDSVARPRAYVNAIQAMSRFKRVRPSPPTSSSASRSSPKPSLACIQRPRQILEVSAKMSAGLSAAEMDEYIDTYRALVGEVPQEARERVLAHLGLQVAGGIKTWGAATVAESQARLHAPELGPGPPPPPPPPAPPAAPPAPLEAPSSTASLARSGAPSVQSHRSLAHSASASASAAGDAPAPAAAPAPPPPRLGPQLRPKRDSPKFLL
eukprot:tig00000093_g3639.t1